jgi:hypothetical protein
VSAEVPAEGECCQLAGDGAHLVSAGNLVAADAVGDTGYPFWNQRGQTYLSSQDNLGETTGVQLRVLSGKNLGDFAGGLVLAE